MSRPNHTTSDFREPKPDESPASGNHVIGKRGITIPWGWITSLVPTAGLGGAMLHSSLFGAPPEFSSRLDAQEKHIEVHDRAITEMHEDAALTKQQMHQIIEDLRWLREHAH